ncbi:tRNA epoxyqueuosine(34) reductase QueG [Nannocystaceae bacterium ST9]
MSEADLTIDEPLLAQLAREAERLGLLRLGIVRLDHPGLARAQQALADYLADGKQGEMDFIANTRAMREDPRLLLAGSRSALVGLVPYAGVSGPVARYAQWADYHTEVHRRLQRLRERLESLRPGVDSRICVDTKPLLERSIAMLAGLGFLGKHGCLIAPGLGSYVLIGALITTARWTGPDHAEPPGDPWDACGSCTRCLDACPTAAFEAPGKLEPRRCIAYLTIEHRGPIAESLAERVGERVAGCDVCQEVCPYNHSEGRAARVPAQAWLPPPPGHARVADLVKLAVVGNNQHRQFVKHTPLDRIPRRALRRNALVALGNRSGPIDDDERAALIACCGDPDPGLAEVAKWAARRRGIAID